MTNSNSPFVRRKMPCTVQNAMHVYSATLYMCLTKIRHRIYRVAQKSKPLPNKQKIVLKPVSEIRFIRQFKYVSRTIILFVGIRYSMRDLHSDLNNYT